MSAEAGPARRRGCCGWGCGGCLLLVAVATLASWFAYTEYGAPWVAARRAEIVERFPWIGKLLGARQALEVWRQRTVSRGSVGSTLRDDFPADVWLPEGAVSAAFNSGPEEALAALTLAAGDPAGLAGRMRREMVARGWSQREFTQTPHGHRLLFAKENRRAHAEIFRHDDQLELWVQVTIAE